MSKKRADVPDFTQWPVIGRGDERTCFGNPDDPRRCIKVSSRERAKQSHREIRYFRYLKKRGVPFCHIPEFFRVIETESFLGIEQERILDPSGKPPDDMRHYLKKPLSASEQKAFWDAMADLKSYLVKYNVIPCDLVMSNMLMVESGAGLEIKMVDGLGGAEFIPFSNYLPFFGKRKIDRKWQKFIDRIVRPHFELYQNREATSGQATGSGR